MSSAHRGTSPRPTPSTTTAQTTSPRSPDGTTSAVSEAGIDPGDSDADDSEENDTDSLADADDDVVASKALQLLGYSQLKGDAVPPRDLRARSEATQDELVKLAQADLLARIKDATATDWLRPCPPAFAMSVDDPNDGPDAFPWTDAAFNAHGVTRSLAELGIEEGLRPAERDVDLSWLDAPPPALPGMQPEQLSRGVRGLGVF